MRVRCEDGPLEGRVVVLEWLGQFLEFPVITVAGELGAVIYRLAEGGRAFYEGFRVSA
ncbi:MAG: hypothetical protein IT181_13115 [Acidobacteria bacterium]|nr:hypothetical protein [Acidobacteriota bacterium]